MGTSSDNRVWSVLTDILVFGLPRGMGMYNEPVLAGESETLISSLVLLWLRSSVGTEGLS